MIPVRLAIRNFMSYTDVHEPLVLDGVHIACLSGENGAGKSTLLDAITWALWGRSRAPTQDHLIHTGRNDMEVELEFVLAEQTYRVVRKRTRTGRGSTVLDLAVGDGGSFRSISGNSVNETEAVIENLLRMSYGTFVSSSFVLQGKADSFTTSTPTERKQVLADILELSEYDRLQERSRREVQQREQQHRELEAAVRQADSELERRAEFQAEQARLETRLGELDDQLKRDGAELQLLQQRLADLLARDRELSEVSAQAAETEAEIARYTKEIAEREAELGKNRSLLDREREIEKGFTELLAARERDEELGGKLREFARLCDERNRLDKHVATERTRLEAELRNLDDRIARLDAEASRVREHQQEEQRARQALDELSGLQERQRELERTLGQRREQEAELRGANQRLRGEMLELKAKIDALEGAPICPICRSPLDVSGREGLIQRYTAEGRTQKVEYERNQGQIQRLKAEIEELGSDLERVKGEMGRLLGAERRLATAEQAMRNAQRAAKEMEGLRMDQLRLRTALHDGDFARAEVDALEGLRRRLDELGYDDATHRRIRADVARTAPYESLKRELDSARQAIAYQEQLVDHARRSLANWQERRERERRRVEDLRVATRELPELRERTQTAGTALDELRRAQSATNRELGEARQRLTYLDHLAERRGEKLRQMDELLREKGLYGELVAAFGKNGIQAMIIETAIPEIEDESNRLLGAMTEGRMHVKFETQRERRTGDGTIETLDIIINDELGPRPYEMYSGGEAFRVNFAIRIALSRLLARRAGARLQTLVIDEGFGSQDDEGRERLVEAIHSVMDEFAMILVITHLDELRERFPVRIEVQKTALGSTTSIEWVA